MAGAAHRARGPVAQLVEQRVYTACVVGSSPAGPTQPGEGAAFLASRRCGGQRPSVCRRSVAQPELLPHRVEDGPGWLNLVIVAACWNALTFIWIGPISLILG